MSVEKISTTIRYSQDTGHGAWKVIELGAEATISDRQHWKQAQPEWLLGSSRSCKPA